MKKYTFELYRNRFWSLGELICNDGRRWHIHKFWKVTSDWFFIYETGGSTGGGYYEGEIIHKVYIGDGEYELKMIM